VDWSGARVNCLPAIASNGSTAFTAQLSTFANNTINMANDAMQAIKIKGRLAMPRNLHKISSCK